MPHIAMTFADPDAKDAWPDLASKQDAGQVEMIESLAVAVYQDATISGAPSVCFRFDTKDGGVIIAQVTVRNVMSMAAAIRGRLSFLGIDENGAPTRPPAKDAN